MTTDTKPDLPVQTLEIKTQKELRRAAASGYSWSTVGRATHAAAQFLVMAVLARFLSPAEIGIVGLTLVIINILLAVTDVGFGGGVVQRHHLPHKSLSTLFWLGVVAALFLAGILFWGAELWAAFAGNPEVAQVMRALIWTIPLAAIGIVPTSLLNRDLRFRSLAVQDGGASIIAAIAAIFMAINGYGLWSLVAWSLVQTAMRSILALFLVTWRPQWQFDLRSLSDLWSFGALYALSRLVSTVSTNLDYLIVGKLISATALGFYTLAFQTSRMPTNLLARVIARVAFPLAARTQSNQEVGRQSYLLQINLIAALTMPASIMMIVFAGPLVWLVYGPGWEEAAHLLAILGLTGTIASLGTLSSPPLLGNGRSDWALYFNLARMVLLSLFVIAGAQFGGVIGVAWAVLFFSIVSFSIGQIPINWVLHTTWQQITLSLLPASLSGGIMLVIVMVAQSFFPDISSEMHLQTIIFLVVISVIGIIAYFFSLLVWPFYRRLARAAIQAGLKLFQGDYGK